MFFLIVSKRRTEQPSRWTAESLPIEGDWLRDIVPLLKSLELKRPGCEVFAINELTEEKLAAKWEKLLAGQTMDAYTYPKNAQEMRRLELEMSDNPVQPYFYSYRPFTHFTNKDVLRKLLELQARVTKGDIGGPDDGADKYGAGATEEAA